MDVTIPVPWKLQRGEVTEILTQDAITLSTTLCKSNASDSALYILDYNPHVKDEIFCGIFSPRVHRKKTIYLLLVKTLTFSQDIFCHFGIFSILHTHTCIPIIFTSPYGRPWTWVVFRGV